MIPAWVLSLISTVTKAAVAGALEAWSEWQIRGERAFEETTNAEDKDRADRLGKAVHVVQEDSPK